jgi:NADPH:quinone reductase-like Zn-dependent oxidoreductase
MQLEEVPDPQPGPGQVVVRVHAAGINPVETYVRSGIYPKPPTPFTPGNDGAGIIEAVGPEVNQVTVGDRVYIAGSISGTYAEKSRQRRVHLLPHRHHLPGSHNIPMGRHIMAIQRARALLAKPSLSMAPAAWASRACNCSCRRYDDHWHGQHR